MKSIRKQNIYNLLKGIETGDPESVKVVNEEKYIQHNPKTYEGGDGLAVLFKRLSKTNPKVELVRIFEDGDFVFAHTIYDFSTVSIGFEVFRYEGDQVVEHWDNLQGRVGNMVNGSTEVQDHNLTEENRQLIRKFIEEVFISNENDKLDSYLNSKDYQERSTFMNIREKARSMVYKKNHRLLAEGNFILSVCEGENNGVHTSFYDLFRVHEEKIVEHWDTTEKIIPRSEWKNNNGKF